MSPPDHRAPSHDERWGDHVPWSLRYNVVEGKGDFDKFMTLLATRLHALVEHNEAKYYDFAHFFARLGTESFGRFQWKSGQTYGNMVYYYFAHQTIKEEVKARAANDFEQIECDHLRLGVTA